MDVCIQFGVSRQRHVYVRSAGPLSLSVNFLPNYPLVWALCINPYVACRVLRSVKPESKVSAGSVLKMRVLTMQIGAKLYGCQKQMATFLTTLSL